MWTRVGESAAMFARRSRVAARRAAEGFTVIEMMVALVILGIGIAALTGAISDSLFRATRVAKEAQAVQVADGLLARLGADIPVSPGLRTGQAVGVDWALQIAPMGSEEDLAAWPVRPAEVTLTLRWPEAGHTETATWRTIRVMAQPATAP